MNIGRPISTEAQIAARSLIASAGLDPTAKKLRVSSYLLAKAAAGARVAELSADALELRLSASQRAA
jgi:hypothetical protein